MSVRYFQCRHASLLRESQLPTCNPFLLHVAQFLLPNTKAVANVTVAEGNILY